MISVLEEGLFQVETLKGERTSVGLRKLLEQAHEYSDISGRTPTGRLALLRLCIAVVGDAYRPGTMSARKSMLEDGAFDKDVLEEYFRVCEQDGPRFLLDDERHPFMQAAYRSEADDGAEKPAAALFADLPSGNNHIHLDHRPIEMISVSAAEALEGMLETYMFCTAAAQGYPSGVNNTNPVYCVIRGETLFETIVLNMVSCRELGGIPFGEGMVPWRRELDIKPKEQVAFVSYLEALTWQPRRTTLVFDEDQRVRRIYMQQGRNFTGDGRWRDPWVPFRKKRDEEIYVSIKPELGRQLWRDAGNILSAQSKDSLAPVTVANAGKVWEDMPNQMLPVQAIGLITNQASFVDLTQEMLRIPEALLEDQTRVDRLRHWIAVAERIHGVTAKIIAGDYMQEISKLVGEGFLRDTRDAIFGELLDQLSEPEPNFTEANRAYAMAIRQTLRDNLGKALKQSGTSVKNIKRQNVVEAKTMGYAIKLLKEEGML